MHRPLLSDEPLDDIFRLQVERKVSRNLTLNYNRVLYVLEPTPEAHDVKGKRVRVYEDDDGNVSIRAGDIELTARAFDKEPRARVTQGDIVDNKLLGAVLSQIRLEQLARDEGNSHFAGTDACAQGARRAARSRAHGRRVRRVLAAPETIRQGQWKFGDLYVLIVCEHADGTVGHGLGCYEKLPRDVPEQEA